MSNTPDSYKVIVFRIDDEEYAIDVSHVVSIEITHNLRPLPHTHDFLDGIMELRGSLIPVLNLRAWFDLPKRTDLDDPRVIITESSHCQLGVLVDSATDVIDVAGKDLHTISTPTIHGSQDRVINLNGRMLYVLDIPTLITQAGIDGLTA